MIIRYIINNRLVDNLLRISVLAEKNGVEAAKEGFAVATLFEYQIHKSSHS